jgi:hypothetical protein
MNIAYNMDCLAAYEDTGLEPEEIKPLLDGLDEYRRAEADGRLIALPCKVGNMVYRIVYDCDFPGDCYTKMKCKNCEYSNRYIEPVPFMLSLLTGSGKLYGYYLTKEEAEKALEGRDNA